MSFIRYIQVSSITGLLNQLGSALTAIVFIPLIIQRIGLEAYGIWTLLFMFTTISSIGDFGISKSLVYYLNQKQDTPSRDEIATAGLCVNLAVLGVLFIAGTIILLFDINIWGGNESLGAPVRRLLIISGFLVVGATLLTTYVRALLEAFFQMHVVNVLYFLLTFFQHLSIFIITFFTVRVEYLLLTTTGVYFVVFLLHAIYVLKTYRFSFIIPEIVFFRQMFKYSLGVFAIGTITSLLLIASRYILIYFSHDTVNHGLFDIALKITMMALGVMQAFSSALFGIFSQYGKSNVAAIRRVVMKYIGFNTALYVMAMIGFIVFGKFFLRIITPEATDELYMLTLITMLGITFYSIAEPSYRALLAIEAVNSVVVIKVIQLLIFAFVMLAGVFFSDILFKCSVALSLSFAAASLMMIIWFFMLTSRLET